MTVGWGPATVEELCSRVTSGGTPRRDTPEYYGGDIPWIKTGELLDSLIVDSEEKLTQRGLAESSAKLLPMGTVLMAMYGATVGALGMLGREATCNQASCAMVVDPSRANSRWLYYALLNDRTRIVGRATGAAQQNLSAAAIKQLSFLAPPLSEQQAIAEVLGALDEKIAANTALVTTADRYAATVLSSNLSDATVRLHEIADITMGSSPKGETLNESGEGVPFYQGVRDFGTRWPTQRVSTTSPVRLASEGDVLVSVRAPVGEVNRAQAALCIGRGLAAVRSNADSPETLFHMLKAEREVWEPFEAEGTVFGSINRDQLRGIELRLIDESAAQVVERDLAAIEGSIRSALIENQILAATRDALLPQLMSGKLRVRDAEAAASEAGA